MLWIASCRTQTLRLFEHQHGISRHLPSRLDANIENESTLFEIVERWNASLPYPVCFAAPGESGNRAAAEDASSAKKICLETLWKVGGGNLVATRLYWLNSIAYDDATCDIVQSPAESASLEYVRNLDREKLFTMLSVFQHAGLSVEEHAEIYLTSPAASRRTFESLVQLGLLDSLAGGRNSDRYDINPAADASLVTILKQLNLIY